MRLRLWEVERFRLGLRAEPIEVSPEIPQELGIALLLLRLGLPRFQLNPQLLK
jgi:hypothetical protein